MNPITLVLAEDHHIVRQGFKALLDAEKDFRLVGEEIGRASCRERV